MSSAPESATPNDITKLTRIQKLAILLIMLGPESAAQILKHLPEHELETISTEMAKFTMVSHELQAAVLEEFAELAIQASTSLPGGAEYAHQALEKAVGLFRASDIVGRISHTGTPVPAMKQIEEMDARQIFNLIKFEQAQTIALVTSYLTPEKASQVLALLGSELREQVIERLATLAPTPVDVVEKVVEVLARKSGGRQVRPFRQTGGIKTAAGLLNALDRNLSKSILASMEERNPELALAIRQKMFTFDDLAGLDSAALQKILREVDMRDLAVALKTAGEKVKNALLSSISKRAAETVNEEIAFLPPLKAKEIEAAQMRIIEVARKLEADGEIDLGDPRELQHPGANG